MKKQSLQSRLELSQAPAMKLAFVCYVCSQVYEPAKVEADAIEAAIFGFEAYEICVSCGQAVPDKLRDSQFYCRWIERVHFFYSQILKSRKPVG